MKIERIIKGADGVTYTAIVHSNNQVLLSYETGRGSNFIVVSGLEKDENGLYTWDEAVRYGEDIIPASRYMEGKPAQTNIF